MTATLTDVRYETWPDSWDYSANAYQWPLQALERATLKARVRSRRLGNPIVAGQASALLDSFDVLLREFDVTSIPALDAREGDDGAVTLEWRFPDRRLAFTLEPDPKESGWHLVSKPSAGGVLASGALYEADLPFVLAWGFRQERKR